MFLELTVTGNGIERDALGYILGKHPESAFERTLSKGRLVRGRWFGPTTYSVCADVMSVEFLRALRKLNFSNYVHAQQSVVCPFSLVCLKEALGSVLKRKYHKNSTRHNEAFECQVVMGPWQCSEPAARRFFAPLAITVSSVGPFVYQFVADHPMILSEFLQKIFVGANILSGRLHIGTRIEWQDKVETFATYAEQWPEKNDRDAIEALPAWSRKLLNWRVTAYKGKERYGEEKNADGSGGSSSGTCEKDDTAAAADEKEGGRGGDRDEEEEEEQETERRPAHEAGDVEMVSLKRNEGGCEKQRYVTLHERRHMLIVDGLRDRLSDATDTVIIDYGCSNGRLSRTLAKEFSKAKVYAVDASESLWRNKCLRGVKNATAVRENLLYPCRLFRRINNDKRVTVKDSVPRPEEFQDVTENARIDTHTMTRGCIDALVLTEVIEHLEPIGRERLVQVIAYVIRPRFVAVTTPNRAYNVNIKGPLCKNGLRHDDHRIEYVQSDWECEVVRPFERAGYVYHDEPLVPDAEVQPSFCGFFTLDDDGDEKSDYVAQCETLLTSIDTMYTPMDFVRVQKATVKRGALAAGLVDRAFLAAADDAFFRAPTIPPVEHTATEPAFLEHPRAAFEYYRERGLKRLVAEHKYMGSRAHVLVFRDREAATAFGWPAHRPLLHIISRSGRAFFSAGGCALADPPPTWEPFLRDRIKALGKQYAILDAEMLPWSLKADRLIERDFRRPGEYALATRAYHYGEDSAEADRARQFLQALEHYERAPDVVEMRVFNVLAMDDGFRGDEVHQDDRYAAIDAVCGWKAGAACGILPVERMVVDLGDEDAMRACCERWERYCDQGGEGFVFKMAPRIYQKSADGDGGMLQPMVKVRGRDYLRLIYGIDYLTDECFAMIKHRRVKNKRFLALKQWELGRKMLEAFLLHDEPMRLKCLAAFCGENAQTYVDATL